MANNRPSYGGGGKDGGSWGGGKGGASRTGGGSSTVTGARSGIQTDANALLQQGITGPSAALSLAMIDNVGRAGYLPNLFSLDRLRGAFSQLMDSPGFGAIDNVSRPKKLAPNPFGGNSAGMSVQGGPSPFQRQLSEGAAKAKSDLRLKEKNLALDRKYANLVLQDRLNMVRSILGKALSGQDRQTETYYERQAGDLVPLTRTSTKNRDYTQEILRILGV